VSAGPPAFADALPRTPTRLHPLSPVVRIGRRVVGIVGVLALGSARGGTASHLVDLALIGATAVAGFASWYVTRWHLDGDALQVSFGVVRRQTVRVPLSRVQAIDLVEPWLARVLGLAEVRVRTGGGSGGDARLMYLRLEEAATVRASLLAQTHGLPSTTPPPPEWPLLLISNRRLVASTLLTGPSIVSMLFFAAFVAVLASGSLTPAAIGASSGSVVLFLIGLVRSVVVRLAHEWGLQVAEAPDGLRIRSGFGSRVAETIPAGRIQAVRMLEPLLWRRFGWYRLELHLAGGVAHREQGGGAMMRRALLPVGTYADATMLLQRFVRGYEVPLHRPPRRAAWRAPLSYHFLSAGYGEWCAVATNGRARRLTEWVPLAKVQSVRSVQGPVQRALRLMSVHLDIAGRHARVVWWHRDDVEGSKLMATLPVACEHARAAEAASSGTRRSAERRAGSDLRPADLPLGDQRQVEQEGLPVMTGQDLEPDR
jgi:putative membrane protein